MNIASTPHRRWFLLSILAAAILLPACSSRVRKLSSGNAADLLLHEVLGQSRNPDYYYSLLKDSHETSSEQFGYRKAEDPFLVDKNVDAAEKLGSADFSRLEGQAMTVVILSHMLLEDPASMARTNAASSLTKIGLRLPRYGSTRGPESDQAVERGDQLLASIRSLDAMHADGKLRDPSYAVQRNQVVAAMGEFHILDLEIARDSLKPFFSRDYLIDATDARARATIDTALVKRMTRLIRLALRAGLDAPADHTRRQSVIGLKLLSDRAAESAVLARLRIESDWQVRAESIEYLGKLASVDGIALLVDLLDAPDPTIRHKSRRALIRIAGRDLGRRRSVWLNWARARFPDRFREDPPTPDDDERNDTERDTPLPGGPGMGPEGIPGAGEDGPLPGAPDDDTPLPPAPVDDEPLPPAPMDDPLPPAPMPSGPQG